MPHNLPHEPLQFYQSSSLKPKPKRLGKRKRVTLIAAFRCDAGGHPAIVLCADTQETVGDTRVAVNKLLPQDAGEYDLAIAGSGNGDLIDGFADSLLRTVRMWPAGATEQFARDSIRDLLIDFYANEVALYPADLPSYSELSSCTFF